MEDSGQRTTDTDQLRSKAREKLLNTGLAKGRVLRGIFGGKSFAIIEKCMPRALLHDPWDPPESQAPRASSMPPNSQVVIS